MISLIKKLLNDASYPTYFLEYQYVEAKITNSNTNINSCFEQSSTDSIVLRTKTKRAVKAHLSSTN